jgi:hypothetical protein
MAPGFDWLAGLVERLSGAAGCSDPEIVLCLGASLAELLSRFIGEVYISSFYRKISSFRLIQDNLHRCPSPLRGEDPIPL